MKKLIVIVALLAVGCATKSGVIPTSQDGFMLLKQGSGFWSQTSVLAAEVMQEAGQFCAYKNKALEVTNLRKQDTGLTPGAFPEAEINFKCVDRK